MTAENQQVNSGRQDGKFAGKIASWLSSRMAILLQEWWQTCGFRRDCETCQEEPEKLRQDERVVVSGCWQFSEEAIQGRILEAPAGG